MAERLRTGLLALSGAPPLPPPTSTTTIPPGPPDLIVTSIDTLVSGGADCTLVYTLGNRGAAAASESTTRVATVVGSGPGPSYDVASAPLGAGENRQAAVVLGGLPCSTVNVTVTADVMGVVVESDEENNVESAACDVANASCCLSLPCGSTTTSSSTTSTSLPCENIVCAELDQCHIAGTCDPGTGICSNPPAADGTRCDDGNPATYLDGCTNGACSGVSCPCDGQVFPGPTGDPAWGPSFRAQTCSSSAPSTGEVVALPALCFGHSDGQYLGHLYVARSIDGQGVYECGAYTTQGFPSAFDCSFNPPTTSITASQAQACLLSLQAIAASRGVPCPF